MIAVLLCVVFGAVPSVAQDGQVVVKEASPASTPRDNETLFLEVGDALVLPALRAYDHLLQDRCDSIMLAGSLDLDAGWTGKDSEYRTMISDTRLAALHLQLTVGEGGAGSGFAEQLGRFLLQQAMQFGYQYARERVRASSLSEMDYLYLPQGPGMTRTFNEVEWEARIRGELQSSRVWRDYHEWKKNRIDRKE